MNSAKSKYMQIRTLVGLPGVAVCVDYTHILVVNPGDENKKALGSKRDIFH